MTTIEILQAAIDEGCSIEIESYSGQVDVEFNGIRYVGWDSAETLETAVASAWQHYQTNKNQ